LRKIGVNANASPKAPSPKNSNVYKGSPIN
jgi:hypothetical protein